MHRNAQGRTEAHGSAQNRTGARRSTQELAGTRSNAHRCTGTHRSARDRPEARTVARRSARDPPGEHTGPHRSARDRPEGHTGPHREAQQRLSGLLQQAVGVSLTQRILVWKLSLRALCNGNRSGNPFARALPLEVWSLLSCPGLPLPDRTPLPRILGAAQRVASGMMPTPTARSLLGSPIPTSGP